MESELNITKGNSPAIFIDSIDKPQEKSLDDEDGEDLTIQNDTSIRVSMDKYKSEPQQKEKC